MKKSGPGQELILFLDKPWLASFSHKPKTENRFSTQVLNAS